MGSRAWRVDGIRARSCALAPRAGLGRPQAPAPMKPTVYDAGALIAADRSDRRRWAEHRVLLEGGLVPLVPAPVVAQVSRSPRQAELRRFLRGCEVVPMDEGTAH